MFYFTLSHLIKLAFTRITMSNTFIAHFALHALLSLSRSIENGLLLINFNATRIFKIYHIYLQSNAKPYQYVIIRCTIEKKDHQH